MFWAMSRKLAAGGPAGGGGGGVAGAAPAPPPRRPPPGPANGAPRQRPERSGLPSAVLGAGALRSTWPAAFFGTSGGMRLGHCADSDGPARAKNAIRHTALTADLIRSSPRRPRPASGDNRAYYAP